MQFTFLEKISTNTYATLTPDPLRKNIIFEYRFCLVIKWNQFDFSGNIGWNFQWKRSQSNLIIIFYQWCALWESHAGQWPTILQLMIPTIIVHSTNITMKTWIIWKMNLMTHAGKSISSIIWLFTCLVLRILIGKKHPKIKLQRLRKIWIWTFRSSVHQIKSF